MYTIGTSFYYLQRYVVLIQCWATTHCDMHVAALLHLEQDWTHKLNITQLNRETERTAALYVVISCGDISDSSQRQLAGKGCPGLPCTAHTRQPRIFTGPSGGSFIWWWNLLWHCSTNTLRQAINLGLLLLMTECKCGILWASQTRAHNKASDLESREVS